MRRFAIAAMLGFLVGVGPAFAVPRIDTISSEIVSSSPFRVKTTFTVQLVGYEPFGYQGLVLYPGSGPAFTFYDCSAPAPWTCEATSFESANFVQFNPPDFYTWPWPGVMTFSITTDQAAPCVLFDFWNPPLSKTPRTNDSYFVDGCLVVDAPTPATSTSWGSVKATYR